MLSVGKEAEVADADETAWQQVQEEATQELIDWKAHDALLVAMSGISPAESDATLAESNEPVVGDGNPMGVVAKITQGMFRAVERWLSVDDPLMTEQQPEPRGEGSGLGH